MVMDGPGTVSLRASGECAAGSDLVRKDFADLDVSWLEPAGETPD